ncbi:MAG: hypothetical protein JNJ84_09195, partial [Rhodobacteraceae bacterium]|nr:hypothetical protein [Paracoccaceae bacterium]
MADGSAAEAAYQRALEEIERVKAEGGQELWLTGFHDLDRIPPEVTDINGLHWLTLDGSEVSDLTPIAAAPELRHLYFSATKVTDLSPLRYMASLCSVVFYKTDISDLRPLLDLPLLGRSGAPGLSFS